VRPRWGAALPCTPVPDIIAGVMPPTVPPSFGLLVACMSIALPCEAFAQSGEAIEVPIRLESRGLHGYIASRAASTPAEYHYGAGFYAPVWPLIERPLRNFQIGLPSTWILPDNADNRTEPLCPPGTIARDHWPERGPTYDTVFQTLEGGLGYWAGNRFQNGTPKFSMNATADCYSNEIATPGWPFFRSSRPLPDDRLGIAQISNRLLIPPDGMTFAGRPNGELLGYAWMALPLIDARDVPQPTGGLSWTLFLNARNFKGPLAFYVPACWSRVSRDYPTARGRGLDSRLASGRVDGSMEINTVPKFVGVDAGGTTWTKIPRLQFPVDASGRTLLVRDVALYSRAALFDAVQAWRDGGPVPDARFPAEATLRPEIATGPVRYRQDETPLAGINEAATPTVFEDGAFGLVWTQPSADGYGRLPQYFRDDGAERVAVDANRVPPDLGLIDAEFPGPRPDPEPYTALPLEGAWATPGPASTSFTARLEDGSVVTYRWWRFVDQPVFAQCEFSDAERSALQSLVEAMHRSWSIDRQYLAPPRRGRLVGFDQGLFVEPPAGLEHGYVPIVVEQRASSSSAD
ncbi:MAG: hypothetical protein ACO38P_09715, partial [Phycisphaerales bacterium]